MTSSPFLMLPVRRMSQPHRGVELERVAAGRGLGVAEHDADLHADLVDEDDHGVGLLDHCDGELAQRLAHQPRLQARQAVAHLALEFGLGRERGHRVDDDQVDGAGLRTSASTISSACSPVSGWLISSSCRLTPSFCAYWMSSACSASMKAHGAGDLLHLGDDLQRQRGLARRFGAVDFDHPAARQATDAQRDVQAQRAGGDDLDVFDLLAVAQAHDRALAELLFDLRQRGLQGLGLFGVQRFDGCVHGGLLCERRLWQKLDIRTVYSLGGVTRVGCLPSA